MAQKLLNDDNDNGYVEEPRLVGLLKHAQAYAASPWVAAALCTVYFSENLRLAACAGAAVFLSVFFWRRRTLGVSIVPSDQVPGRMILLTLGLMVITGVGFDVLEFVLPTPEPGSIALLDLPPTSLPQSPGAPGPLTFVAGFAALALALIVMAVFVALLASLPALFARGVVEIYDAYAEVYLLPSDETAAAQVEGVGK